jgi:hypothetical protein
MAMAYEPSTVPWNRADDPLARARPSWTAPRGRSLPPPPPSLDYRDDDDDPPTVLEQMALAPTDLAAGTHPSPPPTAVPDAPPFAMELEELDSLRDEVLLLRATVANQAAESATLRARTLAASEGDLVALAVAIAERVLRRELATDPAVYVRWAQDAVRALADQDRIVVAIAPDVAALVPAEEWSRALGDRVPTVDTTLPSGGCEVRSTHARVDAGFRAQLDVVLDALDAEAR